MKKVILAGLMAVIACGSALAAATPTFTASRVGGRTFVFDASSSPCRFQPCSYNWRYFTPTGNHLGVQMGNTARIAFRFTCGGRVHGPSEAGRAVLRRHDPELPRHGSEDNQGRIAPPRRLLAQRRTFSARPEDGKTAITAIRSPTCRRERARLVRPVRTPRDSRSRPGLLRPATRPAGRGACPPNHAGRWTAYAGSARRRVRSERVCTVLAVGGFLVVYTT